MAEGSTYRKLERESLKRRSYLKAAAPLLALWFPYWLWVELDLRQNAKPLLMEHFNLECTASSSLRSLSGNAKCLERKVEFISANVGLLWTNVRFTVAEEGLVPRTRNFRLSLSWTSMKWSVSAEIPGPRYYLTL